MLGVLVPDGVACRALPVDFGKAELLAVVPYWTAPMTSPCSLGQEFQLKLFILQAALTRTVQSKQPTGREPAANPDWPTPETRAIWLDFAEEPAPLPPNSPVSVYNWDGQPLVLSSDGLSWGILAQRINPSRSGVLRATVMPQAGQIDISYLGPDDLWLD